MSKNEATEVVLTGPLKPVFEDPELVQRNIVIFRAALPKLLDPKVDMAVIQGKQFIKKSGWNVINGYFNVETFPTKSWRNEYPDGEYAIVVVVKATKEGRSVSRSATCTSEEMKSKHNGQEYASMESNCYGMAETRAVGRASAAWYMVGDVSAEEVEGSPGLMKKEGKTSPTSQAPPGQQGITICVCPVDKVVLSEDGKSCTHCQRILDETKRKLIWREQKFAPKVETQ